MATLGHLAAGLAAGRLHHGRRASRRKLGLAMAGYSALAVLPDADVLAFSLDIPYGAPFGHRGAAHSLVVGLAVGLLAAALARGVGSRWIRTFLLVTLATASHGVLDAFTDGGRGIALLWPFSDERFFAPFRPIPVAPIGSDFLSARGLWCLGVEGALFAPVVAWALWPRRAPSGEPALPEGVEGPG